MAVIAVNEDFNGRSASQTMQGGKIVKEYTRVFQVETDDISDGPATAISASGVPIPLSDYKGALFKSKTVSDDTDGYTFNVVVNYTTDSNQAAVDENPLNRPADISGGFNKRTEDYFRDTEGLPSVNSAGELFQNMQQKEAGEYQITWVKNVSSINHANFTGGIDGVNNSSFTLAEHGVTIGVGECKLSGINWQEQMEIVDESEVWYFRVSYLLRFREDGWQHEIDDYGSFYWKEVEEEDPEDPEQTVMVWRKYRFEDDDGMPIGSGPLNGSGEQAEEDEHSHMRIPATLNRKPYFEINMGVFDFSA